jgi:hypothetical protein
VRNARGQEKVLAIDIWRNTVTLRDAEGERRTVSLDELKAEVGQPLAPRREDDGEADGE